MQRYQKFPNNGSFSPKYLLSMALKLVFEPFISFDTQNGQTTVLTRFCQPEKDSPKNAFRRRADGQQHLGERQDVEGYAAQQDDDTRPERKGLQPLFDFHTNRIRLKNNEVQSYKKSSISSGYGGIFF
jgi:hypothetical protein